MMFQYAVVRFFSLAVLCFVMGCSSVPKESVRAQEIVVDKIKVARNNQFLLIDHFAKEAVSNIS